MSLKTSQMINNFSAPCQWLVLGIYPSCEANNRIAYSLLNLKYSKFNILKHFIPNLDSRRKMVNLSSVFPVLLKIAGSAPGNNLNHFFNLGMHFKRNTNHIFFNPLSLHFGLSFTFHYTCCNEEETS